MPGYTKEHHLTADPATSGAEVEVRVDPENDGSVAFAIYQGTQLLFESDLSPKEANDISYTLKKAAMFAALNTVTREPVGA
jgi:hypothetical protein